MAKSDPTSDAVKGRARKLPDPSAPIDWVRALIFGSLEGLRMRKHFSEVEHFLLFVGHGRSGHSLIGALLNAHPEVVVSHELGVLRYSNHRFTKTTLYGLVLQRDRDFGLIGRLWSGHDYTVPNQYQGCFLRLRVIGDKRGADTNQWLAQYPDLLQRFRRTVGVPLRVLHVTRNPYDNIASLARYNGRSIDDNIDHFTSRCAQTESVRRQLDPDEILDVRYEDFVHNPRSGLAELCRFVGVDPIEGYLDDCASLIWGNESRTRSRTSWSQEQIGRIQEIIDGHPSFAGYAFED